MTGRGGWGAGKFSLVSMGGPAEGLACADPGARTPIGASGNFFNFSIILFCKELFSCLTVIVITGAPTNTFKVWLGSR